MKTISQAYRVLQISLSDYLITKHTEQPASVQIQAAFVNQHCSGGRPVSISELKTQHIVIYRYKVRHSNARSEVAAGLEEAVSEHHRQQVRSTSGRELTELSVQSYRV